MITGGGKHTVEAQLGADYTVVTEAAQECALQRGEQQAFDLCAVGARYGESRHRAHGGRTFACQVESRDADRCTVAPHAHEQLVEQPAQREAELLERGEGHLERGACEQAPRQRRRGDRLHIKAAGEREQGSRNGANAGGEGGTLRAGERPHGAEAEQGTALQGVAHALVGVLGRPQRQRRNGVARQPFGLVAERHHLHAVVTSTAARHQHRKQATACNCHRRLLAQMHANGAQRNRGNVALTATARLQSVDADFNQSKRISSSNER